MEKYAKSKYISKILSALPILSCKFYIYDA